MKDPMIKFDYTKTLSYTRRTVLKHISEGMTTKEIAAVMGLSPRTIEGHRSNLKREFNAKSIPHLMCMSIPDELHSHEKVIKEMIWCYELIKEVCTVPNSIRSKMDEIIKKYSTILSSEEI